MLIARFIDSTVKFIKNKIIVKSSEEHTAETSTAMPSRTATQLSDRPPISTSSPRGNQLLEYCIRRRCDTFFSSRQWSVEFAYSWISFIFRSEIFGWKSKNEDKYVGNFGGDPLLPAESGFCEAKSVSLRLGSTQRRTSNRQRRPRGRPKLQRHCSGYQSESLRERGSESVSSAAVLDLRINLAKNEPMYYIAISFVLE